MEANLGERRKRTSALTFTDSVLVLEKSAISLGRRVSLTCENSSSSHSCGTFCSAFSWTAMCSFQMRRKRAASRLRQPSTYLLGTATGSFCSQTGPFGSAGALGLVCGILWFCGGSLIRKSGLIRGKMLLQNSSEAV